MTTVDGNRLVHLMQTLGYSDSSLPHRSVDETQVSPYLSALCAGHPETTTSILHRAFRSLFSTVREQIFADKRTWDELANVNVNWWEPDGHHRTVNAEYYLENWKANYAKLASNWQEVADDPRSIDRISADIMACFAALLYVQRYEGEVIAALRYRQQEYPRLAIPANTLRPQPEDRDTAGKLETEIAERAGTLQYPESLDFLAELTGAYILSCPLVQLRSLEEFDQTVQRNPTYSAEEVGVSILIKYLFGYGSQEFAMDASWFPLRLTKAPGEDWKFIVEIPSAR